MRSVWRAWFMAIWRAHSGALSGFALLLLTAVVLESCCPSKQNCVSLQASGGVLVMLEKPNPDAGLDDVLASVSC